MTSSTLTVVPQITALASPVVSVAGAGARFGLFLCIFLGVAPTIVRCLNADDMPPRSKPRPPLGTGARLLCPTDGESPMIGVGGKEPEADGLLGPPDDDGARSDDTGVPGLRHGRRRHGQPGLWGVAGTRGEAGLRGERRL